MGEMDDITQEGSGKSADNDDQMNDFVNSARTGRRNAVPEVDTQGMDPDAVKLAERLSSMNTASNDECRRKDQSADDSSTVSASESIVVIFGAQWRFW
ncbi:unnamed protein product [Gongylonema pulchrum]|uniref:Uncharacterized protein n=1 Tax=Gongylonema pulchrum TaxID=637853 RepID=A0A183D6B2_9BILA|nr:unnamed protein product [Gongylonema pulchrum]